MNINPNLVIRIDDLPLPQPVINRLYDSNYCDIYVGELVQHTEAELLAEKLDPASLNKIKTVLAQMGLMLGMKLEPPPSLKEWDELWLAQHKQHDETIGRCSCCGTWVCDKCNDPHNDRCVITCPRCKRTDPYGMITVPDDVWRFYCPIEWQRRVLCLDCWNALVQENDGGKYQTKHGLPAWRGCPLPPGGLAQLEAMSEDQIREFLASTEDMPGYLWLRELQ